MSVSRRGSSIVLLTSSMTVAAPLGSCCKRNDSGQKSRHRNHHAFQENSRFWSASRVGDFQGEMSAESYVCRLQERVSAPVREVKRVLRTRNVSRWSGDGRKMDKSVAGCEMPLRGRLVKRARILRSSLVPVVCMQPRGMRPTSRLVLHVACVP